MPAPLYVYVEVFPAESVLDDARYAVAAAVFAYAAVEVAPPGACSDVIESPLLAPYVAVLVPAVDPVPDVAVATSPLGVYVAACCRPISSVDAVTRFVDALIVYARCGTEATDDDWFVFPRARKRVVADG